MASLAMKLKLQVFGFLATPQAVMNANNYSLHIWAQICAVVLCALLIPWLRSKPEYTQFDPHASKGSGINFL